MLSKKPNEENLREVARLLKGDSLPESQTYVNEKGGKQSHLNVDFTQIPAPFLIALADLVRKGGEKYNRWNWLKISTGDHLNHAINHIYHDLLGADWEETKNHLGESEDHLLHAACRLMMAWVAKNVIGGEENLNDYKFPET